MAIQNKNINYIYDISFKHLLTKDIENVTNRGAIK